MIKIEDFNRKILKGNKLSLITFVIFLSFVMPLWCQSQNCEIMTIAEQNYGNGWIKLKEELNIQSSSIFDDYKSSFELGINDEMVLKRTKSDNLGFTHYRFQQTYKSVDIEGAEYIIHEKGNKAIKANGKILVGFDEDVNPSLTETEALNMALAYLPALKYMWQDEEEENLRKIIKNDTNATYYPQPELVITRKSNGDLPFLAENFLLAYKINIYTKEPYGGYSVYVNAKTGEILKKISLITNGIDVPACTLYNGIQNITTEYVTGSGYRLWDNTRGGGILTLSNNADVYDSDDIWDGSDCQITDEFTQTHWAGEMTYDYFLNIHGRDSYDGNGAIMIQNNSDAPNVYAAWLGSSVIFGTGSMAFNGLNWINSLDIVGHEWTHGVTEYSAELESNNHTESGALNESFSDIFGSMVECYAEGLYEPGSTCEDFLIGEEMFNLACQSIYVPRDMCDPAHFCNPDTYGGTYWQSANSDDHNNCGVQNKWFCLLAKGGSGTNNATSPYTYNVMGITKEKVADIAYRNLTNYLISTSNYQDACQGAIEAAKDLYGDCSNEVLQTVEAWKAVGVNGVCDCAADLFMQDAPQDFGIEPNPDNGPMWISEDIWVRNQNDGFTTQIHQNPEYSTTVPNYVYVKIQNRGCDANLGTVELLELRWAKASTSLSWPDNWDGSVDLDPNPFVVALAGNIVSTQTIPIIQPGSFKILEFPWLAPNPAIYSGINTEPWHFCLLARILSSNDPMASVETSDIYSNVRNNNNIVWKNLTVVDIFPYVIPTASTMVRNGSDVITVTKLKFDNPEEEDADPFLNYGSIKINLGHDLFQKWDDGGRVGYGIEVCSDSIIHLLSPHSWIGNISLNPQEAFFIKAFFDLIIQPEECNFTFDISQCTTISESEDKIIGGNRFILNTAIANAGKDTAICNGTNTTLTASGGMVYSWSTGETTRSITVSPNVTITYTVTVSSSCGTASDDVTVTVNPNPAANAGIDQTICFGISDTLTASGGETYAWSTGATTTSINVTPVYTTTYTVTVTDANGCFATDDVVVTVNPLPLAAITSFSNVTCNSEEDGSIDITVTDGTSPYSFNWSDGSVTEDISEISAGTYVVTVTDAAGCTATNDITITEPLPVSIPPALYEEWVARYNSITDTSDVATDITIYSPRTVMKRKSFIDGKGNIYVIGVTTGTTTDKDYVTIKYNSAGEEKWVRTFNGIANGPDIPVGIAVDNNGGIYVTGSSFGNGTNFDFATVKYDTNGTQQWIARYNSTANDTDFAVGIAVNNNFIYVTGYSKNSSSWNNFTTIKYNQSGVQQWVKTYNGTGNKDDKPSDIAIDKQGNIIITGSSDNATNKDYVTIKYALTGVQQWVTRYNGTGNGDDLPKAVGIDAQNNIYITGSSVGNGTSTDFATLKYNANGIQQWVTRYNGAANGIDEAIAIAIDKINNVYVTGFSTNPAGNKDYTTISYSSSGQSRWLQSYDGTANLDDYPTDIAADKDNNVYVTGASIYDPCTATDYTTIKYKPSGTLDWLQRYNGTSGKEDIAAALAVDVNNNVYVTGTSRVIGNSFGIATVKYSLLANFSVSNLGYLEFKDNKSFETTLNYLIEKDSTFLSNWENQIGFLSMRNLFDQIVEAELILSQNQEGLSPHAIQALQHAPIQHAPITDKYKEMLITVLTEDSAGYFDKNINSEEYSYVVNKDGIVSISDTIYQYTKEYIKMITDGDISKIELMKKATQTDIGLNIIVLKIEDNKGAGSWLKSATGNNGRFRVIQYLGFTQNVSGGQTATTWEVKGRSLQRRLFGAWYDNYKATITLSGNHTGNITYGQMTNGIFINLNWSGGYNVSQSNTHTFIWNLPYVSGYNGAGLITTGAVPIVYHGTHVASASGSHYVSCTISY